MNASNMSADYHHIEIHTIKPDYLLDLFENVYHFQLIGKRQTEFYSQWILQSCLCRLIISSMNNFNSNSTLKIDSNHYDILTSIVSKSLTADYILNRDTVFNVALQVKSIQTILDNNPDLEVINNKTSLKLLFFSSLPMTYRLFSRLSFHHAMLAMSTVR